MVRLRWWRVNLNEYQEATRETAFYPEVINETYLIIALGGEVGEIQDKYKKFLRGDFDHDDFVEGLFTELGDVLWYLARLSDELGYSLEDVAGSNLEKLRGRAERGTLTGNGDNR